MFIDLLNKLNDAGRETPEKIEEPPYIEPKEPEIIPPEVPIETPSEKPETPIPETPPLKQE